MSCKILPRQLSQVYFWRQAQPGVMLKYVPIKHKTRVALSAQYSVVVGYATEGHLVCQKY